LSCKGLGRCNTFPWNEVTDDYCLDLTSSLCAGARLPLCHHMAVNPSTRWAPNCWCKLAPKGAPTPQYSSPPKGQRTKEPLRRATPSSTTANSTTTATTKQKLDKTTIAYYFGVLHHLMLVPTITMTLLYIGMGVDDDFPQTPSSYFLPSPRWTRYLQEAP
jgi:hypothetical protein